MIERTYRISDLVNDKFLRFPLTLLANPRYRTMSLEAKLIYSLLLNRMTLSQKNNWINEENEVYLIYTREEAANTLNISYRKAIAAFKELIEVGLLYEQRQGRGYPNLLYVLMAELEDEDAIAFSEEFEPREPEIDQNEPVNPHEQQTCNNGSSRHAEIAVLDMQKWQFKTCKNGSSGYADSAVLDMPNLHPSNIDNIYIENSDTENSQSVGQDGQTGHEKTLWELFEQCEFELFQPNIRVMFQSAIERLYYSESVKVGKATLPQALVRLYLSRINGTILVDVLEHMQKNQEQIINPTAYLLSTIINTICEQDSELILGLPPEFQKPGDFYVRFAGGTGEGGRSP